VIDLHPVRFAPDGTGIQAGLGDQSFTYAADGFTQGSIEGTPIPCLSARQQLAFRSGYELRPVDHYDLELLHAIARA
jgi:lincosamide nucleotidyltransferase A/C/D/E